MKTLSAKANCKGLTLLEVLVVITILLVLFAMLIPATTDRNRKGGTLVRCMSNQRQLALGLILWNSDNTNLFPWQVSATNGGALDAAASGQAAPIFLCLSNYLRTTTMFVCPADTNRMVAATFGQFHNFNLSYFAALDAGTNAAASVLMGDRHLAERGKPINPGLFIYSAGSKLNWTRELHSRNTPLPRGILTFEDGHTETVKDANVDSIFLRESLATNRLVIP